MGQLISAQVHGIGQYKQNTIMLEWSDSGKRWALFQDSERHKLFRLMRLYRNLNMSLLLLSISKKYTLMERKKICIWWDPSQENGSFSLLLAYLISTSNKWEGSEIQLKSIVLKDNVEKTKHLLDELVQKSRINTIINVYHPDPKLITKIENRAEIVDKIVGKNGLNKIKDVIKSVLGQSQFQEDVKLDDISTIEKIKITNNKVEMDEQEQIDEEESEIKQELSDQIDTTDEKLLAKTIKDIIIRESSSADLVLLGFNLPKEGEESEYIRRMNSLLEEMPTTLLVNCPFDVDLFG